MNFINEKDQEKIKRHCNMRIKNGDLIRVKALAVYLEEKYCLYDILCYMKSNLKIESDKIWRGEIADYIITLPRGHVQISNQDLYFGNKYYHQYVIAKQLDIEITEIDKYVIHHIDEDKGNNDIENFFVFYDVNSHVAFHQALKHNARLDIKNFNAEYIDGILTENNAESIKRYLEILDKIDELKRLAYNTFIHKKNTPTATTPESILHFELN